LSLEDKAPKEGALMQEKPSFTTFTASHFHFTVTTVFSFNYFVYSLLFLSKITWLFGGKAELAKPLRTERECRG